MLSEEYQALSTINLHDLPLYGREKELHILQNAYRRIRKNCNNRSSVTDTSSSPSVEQSPQTPQHTQDEYHHQQQHQRPPRPEQPKLSTTSTPKVSNSKGAPLGGASSASASSCTSSSSQIVFISGPSGNGKSSLVEEFKKRIESEYPTDFTFGTYQTYYGYGKFNNTTSNTTNTTTSASTSDAAAIRGEGQASTSTGPDTTTTSGDNSSGCMIEPYFALRQACSELCDSILNTKDRDALCYDIKQALSTTTNDDSSGGGGVQRGLLTTSGEARSEGASNSSNVSGGGSTEGGIILSDVVPNILGLLEHSRQQENDKTKNNNKKKTSPKKLGKKKSSSRSETQGNQESYNRLKYLFKAFIRTICQHRSVILFIDDIQWCDESTLGLIECILVDFTIQNFMFIGAYRDDDTTTNGSSEGGINKIHNIDHPLIQMINNLSNKNTARRGIDSSSGGGTGIKKEDSMKMTATPPPPEAISSCSSMNEIQLGPLSVSAVNEIIKHAIRVDNDTSTVTTSSSSSMSPTTSMSINNTQNQHHNNDRTTTLTLAELIQRRTNGNAFIILEYLQLLVEEKLLQFSIKDGYKWIYNVDEIEMKSTFVSNTVIELVMKRIHSKLPKDVLLVLQVVSCFYNNWSTFSVQQLYELWSELIIDDYCSETGIDDAGSSKDSESAAFVLPRTMDDLMVILKIAVEHGVLDHLKTGNYKFSHDRIQQGVYSLIPNDEDSLRPNEEGGSTLIGRSDTTIVGESREKLHLRLGRVVIALLGKLDIVIAGIENDQYDDCFDESTMSLSSISDISKIAMQENRRRMVFMAADQLNRGSRYLSTDAERISVAKMNDEAAQAAMSLSAFIPARNYAKAGIDLLRKGKPTRESVWDDETNYDLTLSLHSLHTEMSACVGRYHNQESYDIANSVLLHGKCLQDKLPVYLSQIDAYGHITDFSRAMTIAQDVLKQLGEPIMPRKANMVHVIMALVKTKRLAKGKSDEGFLSLPMMTDEKKSAAMKILNRYAVHAVMSQRTPDLLLAMLCKFQLTLKYGLHKISPVAIASYGLVLASLGNIDEANRLGKLSMKLFEQIDAAAWEANCIQIYHSYVAHWRESFADCMQTFLRGYKTGMSYGDIEFAFYNGTCYCHCYYFSGLHLIPLENDFRKYASQMVEYKRDSTFAVTAPAWQLIRNLIGMDAGNPLRLDGAAMNEDKFVSRWTEAKNMGALQTYWVQKAQVSYYFGDLQEAERVSIEYAKTKSNLATHMFTVFHTYFYALTCLGLARTTRKRRYRVKARSLIKEMTGWVRQGNVNLPNRIMLLNAEYLALSEKNAAKLRKSYDAAIMTASRAGFIQDAAICNELAGICFGNMNDEYWSTSYLRRARDLYLDWGAKAKALHLMKSHKKIFLLELEPSHVNDDLLTVSLMSNSTPGGVDVTNADDVANTSSTKLSCNDSNGSSDNHNNDIVDNKTDGSGDGSSSSFQQQQQQQQASIVNRVMGGTRRQSTSFRGIERFDPSAVNRHASLRDLESSLYSSDSQHKHKQCRRESSRRRKLDVNSTSALFSSSLLTQQQKSSELSFGPGSSLLSGNSQ